MGGHRFDSTDWKAFATSKATSSVKEIFTVKSIDDYLNPNGIKVRESRDSEVNPNSTALAVALDVTGSMGEIARYMAQTGLGVLFEEIYKRKPVSDPHIMAMAIGDVRYDRSPLQVTQFEAGVKQITEQLTKIHVEGGGGGNGTESYELAWYFAGAKTSIDCFEKRGKRGYLFTIGDEEIPDGLEASHLQKVFGADASKAGYSAEACLQMASRYYEVFHILVEEGSHPKSRGVDYVASTWQPLMGQRLIRLANYKDLAEVIVSIIQVVEGENKKKVLSSWSDGAKASTVAKAINALVPVSQNKMVAGTGKGVVAL